MRAPGRLMLERARPAPRERALERELEPPGAAAGGGFREGPRARALERRPAPMEAAREELVRAAARRGGLHEAWARDLEAGVFNWSLQYADDHKIVKTWRNPRFADVYAWKARSVLANVDPAAYVGNTRLRERLVADREFAPHDVAFMRPENAFPERWRAVLDAKQQREDYMKNAKPAAMTDQFTCKRCRKRECSYTEVQLRSCDEPATLFIVCHSCGNRWRM